MRTIWKYPLALRPGLQEMRIPMGAILRHVAQQGESPTLWFDLDSQADKESRYFVLAGTGTEIPAGLVVYRGTCLDGDYVWHVYETERVSVMV
jgi:hypothetical protein